MIKPGHSSPVPSQTKPDHKPSTSLITHTHTQVIGYGLLSAPPSRATALHLACRYCRYFRPPPACSFFARSHSKMRGLNASAHSTVAVAGRLLLPPPLAAPGLLLLLLPPLKACMKVGGRGRGNGAGSCDVDPHTSSHILTHPHSSSRILTHPHTKTLTHRSYSFSY